MSVDTTRRTIEEYLGALRSRGDFARHLADDVVMTMVETGDEVRGRDAVRDSIAAMHTRVFDGRMDIRRVLTCDGAAVLEADFVGQQREEFAGIAPTGARVQVSYCVVYDIADDRITALRAYLPLSAMVAQLQAAASG